jgi:hypothetical protein
LDLLVRACESHTADLCCYFVIFSIDLGAIEGEVGATVEQVVLLLSCLRYGTTPDEDEAGTIIFKEQLLVIPLVVRVGLHLRLILVCTCPQRVVACKL